MQKRWHRINYQLFRRLAKNKSDVFFFIFFKTEDVKYPTFIFSFSFQVCQFVSLIIHGDWTNPALTKSWHLSAQIESSSCFNLPREYVGYCSVITGWKMCMFDAWGGKEKPFCMVINCAINSWMSTLAHCDKHAFPMWFSNATCIRAEVPNQLKETQVPSCCFFAFDESAFLWRIRNWPERFWKKKLGKHKNGEKIQTKNALSTCPKKV